MDIILYLLQLIQQLYHQNRFLINFICKYIPLKQWAFDDSHSPKYQKFKIDELPKIVSFRQDWDWKDLISYYKERYGKELENRIAIKNEEIRTLKAGLSGIVRQHRFTTVQDFYTAFYTAQRATEAYQKECDKWEEAYGEKASQNAETMHEKLQRYQEMADRQNASQPYRSRDKGAR